MTAPTLYRAADPRRPMVFTGVDALAAHLVRQRPGRRIVATQTVFSIDGAPTALGVSVYAIAPRLRRQWMDDPAAFDADWLGLTAGTDACAVSQIEAALARVTTRGGLAA